MLDYTVVAAQKMVSDIKRLSLIFTVSTQLLYIAYLVYALAVKLGFTWLNIVLLSLSVFYFLFFLFVNGKHGKKINEARKSLRHTYKIIKISASSFNLAVLLYSIYAFPAEVKPISIVLASLMTVVWVLQLIIELFSIFAEKKINLLITALAADAEVLTKPINSAQNFVRKIKGEDPIESCEEPTKARKMLDEKVRERREEKLMRKREKRDDFFASVFRKKHVQQKEEKEFAKK